MKATKLRIQTTILVEPIGKARPRHRRMGDGRIVDYIPEPTLSTQGWIQVMIRNIVQELGQFPDDAAIKMVATFYRLRPRSTRKKITKPITKPDIDNIYKLLADALNRYTYRDDAQITTIIIKKRFGDPPRIELLLEEDGND